MPAPIRFSTADDVTAAPAPADLSAVGLADGRLAVAFTVAGNGGRGLALAQVAQNAPEIPLSSFFSIKNPVNIVHGQTALAALPDGRLIAVQTAGASGNPDTRVISGEITRANGFLDHALAALPAGNGQQDPVMALLSNGDMLLVYGLAVRDIRTAVFAANGTLYNQNTVIIDDLRQDAFPGQNQDLAMASNDNGDVVLAWVHPNGGVWAVALTSAGESQAPARLILGTGGSPVTDIKLADDGRGGFLLTVGREVNAAGVTLTIGQGAVVATGSFLLAAAPATEAYVNYDSIVLSDGRILVTWTRLTYDGAFVDDEQVLGRLFSPTGVPDGAAFAVGALTAGSALFAMTSVSAELADGRIAITTAALTGEVRTSYWDPREAGLNTFASQFDDIWAGTRFADVLRMGQGLDNARGGAGHDAILGARGQDSLYGDAGNDTLYGGTADDLLVGGAGADSLYGGYGQDVVTYRQSTTGVTIRLWNGTAAGGEAQGDVLSSVENVVGSDFADVLIGTTGANFISGQGGNDFMAGLAGADQFYGDSGNDTVDYSGSAAAVTVRLWNNMITGGDATGDLLDRIENLNGSAFNDTLQGTSGAANTLTGNGGADYLGGLDGADRLNGGAGNDTLEGGNGADQFVFGLGYGHDRVVQFVNAVDRVDLVGLTFGQFTEGAIAGGVRLTGTGAAAGLILDLMGVTTAQVETTDFI